MAFSEEATDENKGEGSPGAAISEDAARMEKCIRLQKLSKLEDAARMGKWIKYQKLLKLVSQELPDANSNLLKNPIHAIFQKRNWSESAQDAWPQLKPALRLASRFVAEDDMLGFWYHLVWGRREMQDVSKEFGYSLERFSAEGQLLNMAQKGHIRGWLLEFGERRQTDFLSFKAGVRLGSSSRSAAQNIAIKLKWELLELLRDHGSGKNILSETRLLVLNFLIAIVLLHELGHAVHLSVSRSKYEPYYGDHVLAEVGHAWACYAFGGAITTIRIPTKAEPDSVGGFWVATPATPWQRSSPSTAWLARRPPPPVLGELPKNATCWVVATEYIQRAQTEAFWETDVKVHGVKALRVPPPTYENPDSQIPLKLNWMASVSMSRGPGDEMNIEDCSYRDGAGIVGSLAGHEMEQGLSLQWAERPRIIAMDK